MDGSATIKNITISGNISTSADLAGGLVAEDKGKRVFENCKNEAYVSSNGYSGGIVAKNAKEISFCYNEGRIEGVTHAGGIIGGGSCNINNCYNNGPVTATGEKGYAGGICGNTLSTNFLNCYNGKNGTITSANYAGGIVGWLHYGGYSIENCYNLGKIDGITAGGIVSYIYNDIKCRNCYSTGDISGTNVGGIIGSGLWNNTAANVFTNCYYLKSGTVTKPSGNKITLEDNGLTELNKNIIDIINAYIETNSDGIDTSEWLKWQIDEIKIPSFINN